jgi:hypothetical protein
VHGFGQDHSHACPLGFPPEDLDGGGISILFDAVVTLTDVAVVGNKADDDGGGVYTFIGTSTLTNVTIAKNRAGDQGAPWRCSRRRHASHVAARRDGRRGETPSPT